MRSVVIAFVVLIVIGFAAFLVRVQPSGTATIFRSGSRVIVRTTPLYVRAIGTAACRVAVVGDRLLFDADLPNDAFSVHVRCTYTAPPSVPAGWPAGDWCTTLSQRIHVPQVGL